MSRYPREPRSRSETITRDDYRQQQLPLLIAIALPLSQRIAAVSTTLGDQRPYAHLAQEVYNACENFNLTFLNYLNRFIGQNNYTPLGHEITEATRLLTLAVERAELRLRTYQNLLNVRRTLTYD